MLKVFNFDTLDQLFKTAERIQKMHLSMDEIILFKAIAFLSRGMYKNVFSAATWTNHGIYDYSQSNTQEYNWDEW